MEPLVCIILINYNTLNDTIECVKSLLNISYDKYKIIVVENASGDGEMVKNNTFLNSVCDVILTKRNGGFSAGNNLGINFADKKYSPEYFLLLNNDTIVDENFLERLIDMAVEYQEDMGIGTGKICYYSNQNKIDYRGGMYNRKKCTAIYYDPLISVDGIREITFATGCMLLIPQKTIKVVGLLDESYFMYGEDTEYSCRVINSGLKIYYCDKAVIYHKISASCGKNSNFNQYYMARNDLYNIRKYGTRKFFAYVGNMKRGCIDILKKRRNIKPLLWAWIDFLLGKSGKSDRF